MVTMVAGNQIAETIRRNKMFWNVRRSRRQKRARISKSIVYRTIRVFNWRPSIVCTRQNSVTSSITHEFDDTSNCLKDRVCEPTAYYGRIITTDTGVSKYVDNYDYIRKFAWEYNFKTDALADTFTKFRISGNGCVCVCMGEGRGGVARVSYERINFVI